MNFNKSINKLFVVTLSLIVQTVIAAGTSDFVMEVNTELQGSVNTQFIIRTNASLTYNYNVDCDVASNNGYEATGVTGNYTCDYAALGFGPGVYFVGIGDNVGDLSGFPHANFNNNGDKRKIIDIAQWGKLKWTSMAGAFRGADHMIVSAIDEPDLSLVTNMNSMFRFAFLADPDVSNWDVSNVTTFHSMFRNAIAATPDTSNWVTTGAQIMTNMFWNASLANPDMSGWDISDVTDMSQILLNANLSDANYDTALINFGSQSLQSNVVFGAGASTYCSSSAQTAKDTLVSVKNWTISDNGLCSPTTAPDLVSASDSGVSNSDDITAVVTPTVVVNCSHVANTLKLYSNLPVANTLIATHVCSTVGLENVTTAALNQGVHALDYTDENAQDVSTHSPSLALTILNVPAQPALPDLEALSDTGVSNTDNITIDSTPVFSVACSAINNTIKLYDNGTEIVSHLCVSIGSVLLQVPVLAVNQIHPISATQENVAGVSASSSLLNVNILPELSRPNFVDLVAGSDTGTSSVDNITADTTPEFIANCTAINNTLTLYTNQPIFHTLIATHSCTAVGLVTMQSASLSHALQFIQYTEENLADVSLFSVVLSVTVMPVTAQPNQADLNDNSDNGSSFIDNVTSITIPEFTLQCTDAANTLNLYTDNPFANTLIATQLCANSGDNIVTVNNVLTQGSHTITYTQSNIVGTSSASDALVLTIDKALNDFVIQVKTDNTASGSSIDTQFIIPTTNGETYNYNVDCDNDGIDEAIAQTGDYTCDYPAIGTYTIRIKDNTGMKIGFPRIALAFSADKRKVVSLDQWGTTIWTSMSLAFSNTLNMQVTATDVPDFSGLTSFHAMFAGATLANPDTSRWDTSTVIHMSATFSSAQNADPDVSGWDTSNVIEMDRMFQATTLANPDVSGWDTSKVTTMSKMFKLAEIATPDVSSWDVGQVTKMDGMFSFALLANPDVTGWNTSNVTDMSVMFRSADSFTGDLSGLETGNVTNMAAMFWNNVTVNPDTSNWDTSKVELMAQMFAGATSATLLTNGLDTQMVTNMSDMFKGAISAKPDTSSWDTSQVTSMQNMFAGAINANPDMSNWDFSQVIFFTNMFKDVTLPIATYDALLINLANTVGLSINEHFHGGNSVYCTQAAQIAHADLITNFNWTITDGSACAGVNPNVAPSFNITCDIDATDVLQNNTDPEDNNRGFSNAFVAFDNFITDMLVGPANESLQTYTLTISVISDPDLVMNFSHPGSLYALGTDGYIELDIDHQSNGVATLELTMRDTGGTAGGGVNTSSLQFNVFHFADLALDPNLPMDIVYKNTFDPCRAN